MSKYWVTSLDLWYLVYDKNDRYHIHLCANVGSDFWLSIKSVSNTLSCCLLWVCVHNWSVSQWKQYDLQIWSSWRNIIFLKWKAPQISTPENGHAHGEHFRSCTWQIKTLPQTPICAEEISLYTVHIKLIITTTKLELEAPKYSSVKCYVCWNVSWPASADNAEKKWLSLSSKLYSSHCGMSPHQAPMFYITAKCLGSF